MLDDATYAAVTNLCAEERRDERERIATAVGALGCFCYERTNNPGRPHDENCPAGIAERIRSGDIWRTEKETGS